MAGAGAPRRGQASKRLVQLDRIARHADVGIKHLSIGQVSRSEIQGYGNGKVDQFWRVPIYYDTNDGGEGSGVEEKLKLDGTEDIRALEDKLIADMQHKRDMCARGVTG